MTTHPSVFPNSNIFDFYVFTGTIVEKSRWSETHISGGGGGGYTYDGHGSSYVNPIQSTTVTQGEIWLQDDDGNQEDFRFHGAEIPCREGQRMSVIGARASRKPNNLYQMFNYYNISMNRSTSFDTVMKQIANSSIPMRRRGGTYTALVWLFIVFIGIVDGGFFEALLLPILPCWLVAHMITGPQVSNRKKLLQRLLQETIDRIYALPKVSTSPVAGAITQAQPQDKGVETITFAPA